MVRTLAQSPGPCKGQALGCTFVRPVLAWEGNGKALGTCWPVKANLDLSEKFSEHPVLKNKVARAIEEDR